MNMHIQITVITVCDPLKNSSVSPGNSQTARKPEALSSVWHFILETPLTARDLNPQPSSFGASVLTAATKKRLHFPDSISPVELFVSTGYVCWEAVVVVTADRSHSFALSLSRVRLEIFILDSVKDHTACRQDSKPRGIVVNGPRRVGQRSFSAAAAAAAAIKCF